MGALSGPSWAGQGPLDNWTFGFRMFWGVVRLDVLLFPYEIVVFCVAYFFLRSLYLRIVSQRVPVLSNFDYFGGLSSASGAGRGPVDDSALPFTCFSANLV